MSSSNSLNSLPEQEGSDNSDKTHYAVLSLGRPEDSESLAQAHSSQEMSVESVESVEETTGQHSSSTTSEGSGESFITSSSGVQLPQGLARSASQESTGMTI